MDRRVVHDGRVWKSFCGGTRGRLCRPKARDVVWHRRDGPCRIRLHRSGAHGQRGHGSHRVLGGAIPSRPVHGFRPTGTSAFLTDLSPPARRGEAFGYLGVAGNAGMAMGPALGSWLAVEFGYDAMFLASSALGLAAYLMTLRLPETLPDARGVEWQDLNVLKGGTVEPAAWPASVFLLPVAIAFGTFLTVTPDLVGDLGFVYKGSFNTVVVAASILARLVAGKASDRYGRVELLKVGAVLLAVGMTLFSFASSESGQ